MGPKVYDVMCRSQSKLKACVSAVSSARPWAFFAVAGRDRLAPRWVWLEGFRGDPVSDLSAVAEKLAANLTPSTANRDVDLTSTRVAQILLEQLQRKEDELLPMRRRRALALAKDVLDSWRAEAAQQGDTARARTLDGIRRLFDPAKDGSDAVDRRALADAWLRMIRPRQQAVMSKRRRKGRRPWRLNDLKPNLLDEPLELAVVERAFDGVPTLPPLADRVVAMIVGVPEEQDGRMG